MGWLLLHPGSLLNSLAPRLELLLQWQGSAWASRECQVEVIPLTAALPVPFGDGVAQNHEVIEWQVIGPQRYNQVGFFFLTYNELSAIKNEWTSICRIQYQHRHHHCHFLETHFFFWVFFLKTQLLKSGYFMYSLNVFIFPLIPSIHCPHWMSSLLISRVTTFL